MRNREIIEEINESINSSVAGDVSKFNYLADKLQSSSIDISLISEIRSNCNESCDMSVDEKEQIQRTTTVLKTRTCNVEGIIEQTRMFPCYKETDVMRFISQKPNELPNNLIRGDNDEDTDDEDLDVCSRYLRVELCKALKQSIKTQSIIQK